MIRQHLLDLQEYTGGEREFRWRGREVTRLEGLTDAVFAFATTLLIVSLEVPHTFTELSAVMQGFVPFLLTFAQWWYIWRRSGKWEQRGTLPHQYCMARKGPDIGPYAMGNVKIITNAGIVTLRGPVKTEQEKSAIEAKAKQVAGVTRVDNQLEIAPPK